MTKLIPRDPAKGCHRSVAEMARELLADDPGFVKELEERLGDRQVVKALAVVRARAGLSQKELAEKMGCGQPKVSKLESGMDAEVRFRDVEAYLEACGHEARIVFVPAGGTLVDEVKMHAHQIANLLDRLVALAGTDGKIAEGVADFLGEAAFNLTRMTKMAAAALPGMTPEPSRSIQVEAPDPDEIVQRMGRGSRGAAPEVVAKG